MFKARSKFILIGILAILAAALIVALALPAMAAGPKGGILGMKDPNIASVQGTLTVTTTVITVTATSAPAVTLTAASGQMVTVIYNSTTGAVQGLMLNKTNQAIPTPRAPAIKTFSSLQGTMTAAGNSVTVTLNAATTVALKAADGQTSAILYNKTTGSVMGLHLSRAGQSSTTAKVGRNKSFGNVQGTLALSGNVITITAHSAPTIALNAAAGQMVTVIYNSTTGAVQGLVLNRTGQALPTPKANPKANVNKNFATIQGALTVAGNIITIIPNTTPVALAATAGQTVGIHYNSTTGAVQGLMLSGKGFGHRTAPNHNGKNGNGHGFFRFFGKSGSTHHPATPTPTVN